MTSAELRARWQRRADEFRRLGALVSGEAVAREILGDLEQLQDDSADLVSPTDAGARAGYHPESICRLIRHGKLTNYGTKHRPRVKLSELPRKAPSTRKSGTKKRSAVAGSIGESASSAATIARDALAGRIGR